MASLEQVVYLVTVLVALAKYVTLGRHCCLWCFIQHDKMVIPPSERDVGYRRRTLFNIKANHAEFLTKGKGDIKKAKFYGNVISKNFFDIEIDKV